MKGEIHREKSGDKDWGENMKGGGTGGKHIK